MNDRPIAPSDSSTNAGHPAIRKTITDLDSVVIRFAGDSGDGMQLTGTQFTNTSAHFGNDVSTFPDFPAEIRAPAGTLAGVSGFQLQFGRKRIHTPGDSPDVLVAMNPAALRACLNDLDPGTLILINGDTFDDRTIARAGFDGDPREGQSLEGFRVFDIPLTSVTHRALEETGLTKKEKDRCKNFFALGLMYWMYGRDLEYTSRWIETKFASRPEYCQANLLALKAGFNYGETTEIFASTYRVSAADIPSGTYRNLTGNQLTSLGFVAASQLTGLSLFLGSYPITPASDILHELSRYKNFGVRTFQAEDEIAAVCSAIGAAFGGALALTTSSGPGIALKSEAIGLAVITELPVIIVNVQRGGPSTGLPTKTEQADLLQAMFGRNGECPAVVLAPSSPDDCFWMAIEAARIATKFMIPVLYLSDGYIANGSEPWRVPDLSELPDITVKHHQEPEGFFPYKRDPVTLARPWATPGSAGLEHRIGGLEKQELTGDVSYDPQNHENMTHIRADKVARIADDIPDAEVFGGDEGELLLVGWGGTYGSLRTATQALRASGHQVSHLHLRHIHPFPKNLEPTLRRFGRVAVAELNCGQLLLLLRSKFLVDAVGINKIQGQPFKVGELISQATGMLGGTEHVD